MLPQYISLAAWFCFSEVVGGNIGVANPARDTIVFQPLTALKANGLTVDKVATRILSTNGTQGTSSHSQYQVVIYSEDAVDGSPDQLLSECAIIDAYVGVPYLGTLGVREQSLSIDCTWTQAAYDLDLVDINGNLHLYPLETVWLGLNATALPGLASLGTTQQRVLGGEPDSNQATYGVQVQSAFGVNPANLDLHTKTAYTNRLTRISVHEIP